MQHMDPVSGRLSDSAAQPKDEAAASLHLPVNKLPIIKDIKFGKINKAINESQKTILISILKAFMKPILVTIKIYT